MSDKLAYLKDENEYIVRQQKRLEDLTDQHRQRVIEFMQQEDAPHWSLSELLMKLIRKE